MARFKPAAVDRALEDAAKAGATAAVKVLRPRAPVGTSQHPSLYYRRNGLSHGTFRKSVRAAKIRGRRSALAGLQGRTIGYVIGPLGKNAFTRYWIEAGTHGPGRHRVAARPWIEGAASSTFSVARSASEAKLTAYARG